MNFFIVLVKFLDWIVASCARLARLIGREGEPMILKEGPTTKMKKKKKKKKKGPEGPGPGPPLGSVPSHCERSMLS